MFISKKKHYEIIKNMSIDFESKIKIKEKDFDDIKQKYENYLLSQNTKISQQQEQIKKFLSIIDELKSDFALKLKDKEDESKHLMQEKDKKVVELNQIETDHKKLLSTVDELNKQIDDIQPEEYQKTFKYIESKKSPILIFGAAGTGKSFFIKSLKSRYPNKNIVILAPTGIAALNIKGQTIHSFFKFPQHPFPSNNDQKRFLVYRNIDILIIDEISMVRCDLLDSINDILKAARNSTEAFGKVQTILMGDPFQLPPVVKRNNSGLIKTLSKFYPDNGFYFFDSLILKNTPIYYVIFNRIFRQNDPLFISCLNRVRVDRNIKSSLEYINKNVNKNKIDIENITTITPYRQTAKNINESRLASINEPEYKYPAKLEGSFCTRNPKDFPAEKDLILKKGAIVMFTQNDQDKRYVNGSLGKVVKLSNDKTMCMF